MAGTAFEHKKSRKALDMFSAFIVGRITKNESKDSEALQIYIIVIVIGDGERGRERSTRHQVKISLNRTMNFIWLN